MKTYEVKTRNWHCKQWVFRLLQHTERFGVQRGDSYADGDGKFILSTQSARKAWFIWLYFMALRNFSGGWTYIVRAGHDMSGKPHSYSAIY